MAVKITELPALDIFAVGDYIPLADVSSGVTKKATGQQFADLIGIDSIFRVIGSADNTKKLAFEVDGFTAGTTRTITPPNRDITLAVILATPQASTSGASIDFTSIPSGVRRITIILIGVSTSGTSPLAIRIGDSGGIETSGYTSTVAAVVNAGATVVASNTTHFDVTTAATAAAFYNGKITLILEEASTSLRWVSQAIVGSSGTLQVFTSIGWKDLSAILDRVRITTVGGTDTFDAGEINISYEF